MSYTVSEIIKNVCGKGDDNSPKSSVLFTLSSHNSAFDETKDIASVAAFEPRIEIAKVSHFVTVDLIFINNHSSVMQRLWSVLNLYGEKMTSDEFDTSVTHFGNLTIVPFALSGKAYINASNPLHWTLMPQRPTGEIDTIRLFFDGETFAFYEGEEFDIEAIQEAVDTELKQEQAFYENIEKKMAEREEYEAERDAKIEQFRANRFDESPLEKQRKERIARMYEANQYDADSQQYDEMNQDDEIDDEDVN